MKTLSGISTIHIRVLVAGEEYQLQTWPGEYRSLMALIYDKVYVEDFAECRGMGRCGTCRVSIDGDATALTGMDRNEAATLSRSGAPGEDIRLSCQILLDENLDGRTVTVLAAE